LQGYTYKKKLETKLLRNRFGNKPKNCFSCVEPPIYADRFHDFLIENLFTNERKFPAHEKDWAKGGGDGGIAESPEAANESGFVVKTPKIKNKKCQIF
jgi:hypothetical protein